MSEDEERRPALRWSEEIEGVSSKKRAKRKGPDERKLTEEALREAALRFLDKQDASVSQVRQLLQRRHERYGTDENEASFTIRAESVLERLQASRVLDDERFARGLAESVRRRGASLLLVRHKMSQRGLTEDQIERGLEGLTTDPELSEDASAALYVKKRRLLTRYDLSEPKERQKALAALARQGFSFDVASRALGL